MTTPPTPENKPARHAPPHRNRSRHDLPRTVLSGLIRGAATATGTALAGWLAAWARDHL